MSLPRARLDRHLLCCWYFHLYDIWAYCAPSSGVAGFFLLTIRIPDTHSYWVSSMGWGWESGEDRHFILTIDSWYLFGPTAWWIQSIHGSDNRLSDRRIHVMYCSLLYPKKWQDADTVPFPIMITFSDLLQCQELCWWYIGYCSPYQYVFWLY